MIKGVKLDGFSNYWIFPTLGKIWSYPRKGSKGGWVGAQDLDGYRKVTLTDDNGKQHCFNLHRVIWMSVHGEIPKDMEINHTTEDKNMNGIQFLELVTHKDNINYGSRNARTAEKLSKKVGAYNKDELLVMVFSSTQEAHRQGYNSGAISACCRNCYLREGNNIYRGYQWKYIN